jgi:hypothetical protein
MVYSIVVPICPHPAQEIIPYQRPLPRRVGPVIEVLAEEPGLNPENGEKAFCYDRQGYLRIRQSRGLLIDHYS